MGIHGVAGSGADGKAFVVLLPVPAAKEDRQTGKGKCRNLAFLSLKITIICGILLKNFFSTYFSNVFYEAMLIHVNSCYHLKKKITMWSNLKQFIFYGVSYFAVSALPVSGVGAGFAGGKAKIFCRCWRQQNLEAKRHI